jgi:hypothetical protein
MYLLLNKVLYGTFFAFREFQRVAPWFHASSRWPAENLVESFELGVKHAGLANYLYFFQVAAFVLAFLFFAYCHIIKAKNSFIAYGSVFLFATFMSSWIVSGARYISSCVAIYLLMPYMKNKYAKGIVLFSFIFLSIAFTVLRFKQYSIL